MYGRIVHSCGLNSDSWSISPGLRVDCSDFPPPSDLMDLGWSDKGGERDPWANGVDTWSQDEARVLVPRWDKRFVSVAFRGRGCDPMRN
jgi:hypothetical protein